MKQFLVELMIVVVISGLAFLGYKLDFYSLNVWIVIFSATFGGWMAERLMKLWRNRNRKERS